MIHKLLQCPLLDWVNIDKLAGSFIYDTSQGKELKGRGCLQHKYQSKYFESGGQKDKWLYQMVVPLIFISPTEHQMARPTCWHLHIYKSRSNSRWCKQSTIKYAFVRYFPQKLYFRLRLGNSKYKSPESRVMRWCFNQIWPFFCCHGYTFISRSNLCEIFWWHTKCFKTVFCSLRNWKLDEQKTVSSRLSNI